VILYTSVLVALERSANASRIYARVWANLAKKGTTIGSHDLMIAATAIALGFSVVTADVRDYGKVKEATIEKFVV
jgi:tRNA(fMet)-specific endonuclease VapC